MQEETSSEIRCFVESVPSPCGTGSDQDADSPVTAPPEAGAGRSSVTGIRVCTGSAKVTTVRAP